MSAKKVVAFRLTDQAAKRLLAQIAADTGAVVFTTHALKQMSKRRITPSQVLNCLKKGKITESPFLDLHGCWKLTIERYATGENIGCSVSLDTDRPKAIVITAFWVTP